MPLKARPSSPPPPPHHPPNAHTDSINTVQPQHRCCPTQLFPKQEVCRGLRRWSVSGSFARRFPPESHFAQVRGESRSSAAASAVMTNTSCVDSTVSTETKSDSLVTVTSRQIGNQQKKKHVKQSETKANIIHYLRSYFGEIPADKNILCPFLVKSTFIGE